MVANFKDSMDGTSWEDFCEVMLRKHFTWKCFFSVPHHDRGDHGIEFYTSCGTIFQCYFPDPAYSMSEYKTKVQNKINEDLKKLQTYETEILEMLNGIKIKHWVLMIPENKSRDLLKYCSKKTKAIKSTPLKFIDENDFLVKIETDDAFIEESMYARNVSDKSVNLTVSTPDEKDVEAWKTGHSEFHNNMIRKTEKIPAIDSESTRNNLITKYVQINELLDAYREQFPEIYGQLASIALNNLDVLKNDSYFKKRLAADIFTELLRSNREQFTKIAISRENVELLSIGWIAQWVAECQMDFIV